MENSVRYRVSHITTYDYHASVSLSQHQIRLRPRDYRRQEVTSHNLHIEPPPRDTYEYLDYHRNPTVFATIEGAHSRLAVQSEFEVKVSSSVFPNPSETPAWENVRESSRGVQIGAALEASEFLFDSPLIKAGDAFGDYARPSFPKSRPILEAALDLTRRICEEFAFDPTATDVSTPIARVLKQKRGVCQDFAHLQIACFRSLGLPARYVSGYINTVPPPGQPKLTGADASHAWVSLYCDGVGWIDLDPTNNMTAGREHIVVAWGRDYSDICPIRGVTLGSGGHSLKVAVDVRLL
jgi:transglutaminase-like putative cysteine protease